MEDGLYTSKDRSVTEIINPAFELDDHEVPYEKLEGGEHHVNDNNNRHVVFKEPLHRSPSFPHKVKFYYYQRCNPKRMLPVLIILALILAALAVAIYFVVKSEEDSEKVRVQYYQSSAVSVYMRILNMAYIDAYASPNSEEYVDFQQNMTQELSGIFVNTELEEYLYGIVITQIRKGSIRLDSSFVFSGDSHQSHVLERLVDNAFTRNTRTTDSFDKYLGPFLIESKTLVIQALPLGHEPIIPNPITHPTTRSESITTETTTTTTTTTTALPSESSTHIPLTTEPLRTPTAPDDVTTGPAVITTQVEDVITTSPMTTTSADDVTTLSETTTVEEEIVTTPLPTCEAIELAECLESDTVPYTHTTFPNLLGHQTQNQMATSFGVFMTLLESNCYMHSRRFLCSLAVPQCSQGADQSLVVTPPCRSICQDFFHKCANIAARLKVLRGVNCEDFPISPSDPSVEGPQSAATVPVCIAAPVIPQITIRLVPGLGDFEGRVEVTHQGQWGSVCDSSWSDLEAQVACRQLGYSGRAVARPGKYFGRGDGPIWLSNMNCMGTEQQLGECRHGTWGNHSDCDHDSDAGVSCDVDNKYADVDLPVQLVGGASPLEGIVMITVTVGDTPTPGLICNDYFGEEEATVVCTMLGLNVRGRVIPKPDYRTTTLIYLDDVDCEGTELNLAFCDHDGWENHNCDFREAVAVSCAQSDDVTTESTQIPTTVRLVDGPDEASGRVEVFHDGQWGTICKGLFPEKSALVLCRMLGFSGEATYEFSRYGGGTGPVWLSNVLCTGTETTIEDCTFDDWGQNSCDHMSDISISCAQVETTTTTSISTVDPDAIGVRLSGGQRASEGRLELSVGGQWGTVCDDDFDRNDAQVACRMLGYNGSATYLGNTYGAGQGPIWLAGIQCQGREASVMDCPHDGLQQHACHHSEDVSIACQVLPDIGVRLVDGPSPAEGRVEIRFNGTWGTVCDDSFDDQDATVLCRMMGFNGSASFLDHDYGEGTGPIWLDDLECTGQEETVLDCDHDGFGQHHCYHSEDVSMTCSYEPGIQVRLVDGRDVHEGRLEVFHDQQWGSVCDDGFDHVDADVVCNMLGMPGPGRLLVFTEFEFDLPIWLSKVGCIGNETTLLDCAHAGWGEHICNHFEDVYISCKPHEPVRLVSGGHVQEGRVEILHDGEWGTVCDDGFDQNDAEVICRYLGYDPSNAEYLDQRFGSGSGQVWLESPRCDGSEAHLSDCRHQGWGVHDCDHNEDVSISCGDTCADITVDFCKGILPYSQTLLPNAMDHFTQDEARIDIEANQWHNFAGICGLDFEHFMCSAHVPKCLVENSTAVVYQPCGSLCRRAREACEPIMLHAEVRWPFEWECDSFPDGTQDQDSCFDPTLGVTEQPPNNSTHTDICVPIEVFICTRQLSHKRTSLPNLLGHQTQKEAESFVHRNHFGLRVIPSPVWYGPCHSELRQFLCALLSPECPGKQLMPCRSVCQEIRASCEPYLGFGARWPSELSCDNFPDPTSGERCLDFKGTPTKSFPTTIESTTAFDQASEETTTVSTGNREISTDTGPPDDDSLGNTTGSPPTRGIVATVTEASLNQTGMTSEAPETAATTTTTTTFASFVSNTTDRYDVTDVDIIVDELGTTLSANDTSLGTSAATERENGTESQPSIGPNTTTTVTNLTTSEATVGDSTTEAQFAITDSDMVTSSGVVSKVTGGNETVSVTQSGMTSRTTTDIGSNVTIAEETGVFETVTDTANSGESVNTTVSSSTTEEDTTRDGVTEPPGQTNLEESESQSTTVSSAKIADDTTSSMYDVTQPGVIGSEGDEGGSIVVSSVNNKNVSTTVSAKTADDTTTDGGTEPGITNPEDSGSQSTTFPSAVLADNTTGNNSASVGMTETRETKSVNRLTTVASATVEENTTGDVVTQSGITHPKGNESATVFPATTAKNTTTDIYSVTQPRITESGENGSGSTIVSSAESESVDTTVSPGTIAEDTARVTELGITNLEEESESQSTTASPTNSRSVSTTVSSAKTAGHTLGDRVTEPRIATSEESESHSTTVSSAQIAEDTTSGIYSVTQPGVTDSEDDKRGSTIVSSARTEEYTTGDNRTPFGITETKESESGSSTASAAKIAEDTTSGYTVDVLHTRTYGAAEIEDTQDATEASASTTQSDRESAMRDTTLPVSPLVTDEDTATQSTTGSTSDVTQRVIGDFTSPESIKPKTEESTISSNQDGSSLPLEDFTEEFVQTNIGVETSQPSGKVTLTAVTEGHSAKSHSEARLSVTQSQLDTEEPLNQLYSQTNSDSNIKSSGSMGLITQPATGQEALSGATDALFSKQSSTNVDRDPNTESTTKLSLLDIYGTTERRLVPKDKTMTTAKLSSPSPGRFSPFTGEPDLPLSGNAQCEALKFAPCLDLKVYNQTSVPFWYGYESQQDAIDKTSWVWSILDVRCNPHEELFLCSMVFPVCEEGTLVLPCREFCETVREDCQGDIQLIADSWNDLVNCDTLPTQHCLRPPA